MAKARWFHRDVLKLPEIPKPKPFDFVTTWFDLGAGQTVHLSLNPHSDSRSPQHFALRVPDVSH